MVVIGMKLNQCLFLALLLAVSHSSFADDQIEVDDLLPVPTPAPILQERDLITTTKEKSPCEGIIGGCLMPASDGAVEQKSPIQENQERKLEVDSTL